VHLNTSEGGFNCCLIPELWVTQVRLEQLIVLFPVSSATHNLQLSCSMTEIIAPGRDFNGRSLLWYNSGFYRAQRS